jgi:hypothetical protein
MISRTSRALPAIILAAALLAQQPETSTFQTTAKFVLIPFTVARGKYLAADLQPSDVILREDGHPRNFTIFQGPNTPNPLPLEIILLFDSTKNPPSTPQRRVSSHWDAKAAYEFLNNWDEPATKAIMEKNGMDIRISVYHYADRQLERLCNATRDPAEVLQAFHRLLDPIPTGEGTLTLLPGSKDFAQNRFVAYSAAWLSESIVASLKDASLNDATAASPAPARRVLIVFSEGYSGTSSPRQNVADAAVALGVPVYPVILDRDKYVEHPVSCGSQSTAGSLTVPDDGSGAPCAGKYVTMPPATPLGDMTGGGVYFPANLNRKTMDDILQGVRDAELAEYVVGFVPEPSQAQRKRKLEVVLKSQSLGKVVGGRRDVVY